MAALIDRAALDSATAHGTLGEDGRSGAALQRVRLGDGRTVIVKRYDARTDFVMRMVGDEHGREVEVYLSGLLDGLPPTVQHPILGAWYDDDGHGVVVMRDLGEAVLTWDRLLSVDQARTILSGLADLHRTFRGQAEPTPTSLDSVHGIFEPERIRPFSGIPLVDAALRGWEYFAEVAPDEVGQRVLALALDGGALVSALLDRPSTLLHGDASTVNMAIEDHGLTLFDWGIAMVGPGEFDVARLLVGCAHTFDLTFDEFLDLHREVAGPDHDEVSLDLALLSSLAWMGWNKALDIVEHPDEEVRARERAGLDWWLAQAGRALERGLV
ncbi:phosphotransferase [Nocardioides stalactiti]|uniref:phosphotransferase n=1 Tax=Nocardioides stalactiti TaxID=2755356 RepID=UPI0016036BE9|nr:phosphotransferase [Nocardioides stalactiti]